MIRKKWKVLLLVGLLLVVSGCVSGSALQPAGYSGGPEEKVLGFLLVFGLPIALGIDAILLVIYGVTLGELGEPMIVTKTVMDVIRELTSGVF